MPEYITKEQVIELLHYNTDEACSSIVADVEQLPAVDVAPVVHGEWVMKPTHMGYLSCCSECGFCAVETNYCPNCGARMYGGESGD